MAPSIVKFGMDELNVLHADCVDLKISNERSECKFQKVCLNERRMSHLDLFRKKLIGALWSISFRSKAVWESA